MDDTRKDKTKKRSYVTQALGKSISRLTQSTYGKRGFADGEILRHWSTIVGGMLANASLPEKIIYPNNKNGDGTLHLRVGNPGLALDIQHMEPTILDRINAHFGYRAVGRLKIIQAPLPTSNAKTDFKPKPLNTQEKQTLAQSLTTIQDPDLKQALENLGHSVTGRNKN